MLVKVIKCCSEKLFSRKKVPFDHNSKLNISLRYSSIQCLIADRTSHKICNFSIVFVDGWVDNLNEHRLSLRKARRFGGIFMS